MSGAYLELDIRPRHNSTIPNAQDTLHENSAGQISADHDLAEVSPELVVAEVVVEAGGETSAS